MKPPLRRCRVFSPPSCAGGTAPVAGPSPFHGALRRRHVAPAKTGHAHLSSLRRALGFTLVELLVALMVMALLALLSWRAIDGMTRTQTLTQARADQVLRLQAAVGQWTADLDALTDTQEVQPLDYDGRALRLTRRDSAETGLDSAGVRVVAWTQRDGQWRRWQSGPLRQRDELARAWQRAALWGQGQVADPAAGDGGGDSALPVAAIGQWQLFYHRGETWTNPLSSVGNEAAADTGTGTASAGLPNGVRLVLSLTPGQAIQGTLTRDWVRPTLEAGQ